MNLVKGQTVYFQPKHSKVITISDRVGKCSVPKFNKLKSRSDQIFSFEILRKFNCLDT